MPVFLLGFLTVRKIARLLQVSVWRTAAAYLGGVPLGLSVRWRYDSVWCNYEILANKGFGGGGDMLKGALGGAAMGAGIGTMVGGPVGAAGWRSYWRCRRNSDRLQLQATSGQQKIKRAMLKKQAGKNSRTY